MVKPKEVCMRHCNEIAVYIDIDCEEYCKDADVKWLKEVKKLEKTLYKGKAKKRK